MPAACHAEVQARNPLLIEPSGVARKIPGNSGWNDDNIFCASGLQALPPKVQ
jgi:hypothetical protein